MSSNLGKLWFVEDQTEGVSTSLRVDQVLFQGKSEFQEVDVMRTPYGLTLVLDGKIQSCELDEQIYHECLIHPAMLAVEDAKQVFIGGGGEGASAREVLRFKSVERVTMVDIDPVVLRTSKEFLKKHSAGAFESPRMNLVVGDCKAYLEQTTDKYDVIIMDLADPLPDGPCWHLYTKKWFEFLLTRLNPGGVFVTQSGPAGVVAMRDVFTPVHHTLRSVFPAVVPYSAHVLSFSDLYGFNLAYSQAPKKPFGSLTPAEYDAQLSKRLSDPEKIFFLDGLTSTAVATLNKLQRNAIAAETRLITEDTGAFLYV